LSGGDWRLPTRKELSGLVNYGKYNPAIDPVFEYTSSDYYWSLDTTKQDHSKVWIVDFSEGIEKIEYKSNSYYARCVRADLTSISNAGVDRIISEDETITLRAGDNPREELITDYTWYEGDNKLGEGKEITLDNITDGEHTITLVTRDINGNEYIDDTIVTVVLDNRVVKKTGQTISYTRYDDGHYQKGIALNYSKIEDYILDRTTGLLWQDVEDNNDSSWTWEEAKEYCASLDGKWRLPTRRELSSLVKYNRFNPSIDDIFSFTASNYYWTIETSVRDSEKAWGVNFSEGVENIISKDDNYYIRCVQSNFVPTANAGADIFIEYGKPLILDAKDTPRKNLIENFTWESDSSELGYKEKIVQNDFSMGLQHLYLTIVDKEGRTDRDDLWVTVTFNGSKVVKRTGQTDSYIKYDDGYYQKGVPLSYSNNGDSVTDNVTGFRVER